MSRSARRGGLRFCSLASSSRHGSSYVVQAAGTTVLVDCGVRLRRTERCLRYLGIRPGEIDAIFLSHEHRDHCRGLHIKYPLHIRHGIDALYSSRQTWHSLGLSPSPPYRSITAERPVRVGALQVSALLTSHDAAEPYGFIFRTAAESLGLITDLGTVPPDLCSTLHGVDHLVLESNHDVQMEMDSGRPPHLVDRILGQYGHLSNEQAGRALVNIAGPRTSAVLLAHLSTECNTPDLALSTCQRHLARAGKQCAMRVAPPGSPSEWMGRDLRRTEVMDQ